MRVERRQEQSVAENRETAVDGSAARLHVRRWVVAIDPEHASGLCIQCKGVAWRLGDIHDPIDDERGRFKFFQRFGLKHPFLLERLDVRRIDLTKRAVALAGVRAGIHQPVMWFIRCTQQAFVGNLSAQNGQHQRQQTCGNKNATIQKFHSHLDPFRVRR